MDGVEAFPQSLNLGSSDPLQKFLSPTFIQSCPATRVSQGRVDPESLPGSVKYLRYPYLGKEHID